MNNNSYGALIIGAGISAVVFVLVQNWFTGSSQKQPKHVSYNSYTARTPGGMVSIRTPQVLPEQASPVAQNSPITEAAYSVQPTTYAPTLGPEENTPNNPVILPA